MSNIFWTYSLFLMFIINSLFHCFTSFKSSLFLKFSFFLPYKALIISFCKRFSIFVPIFSASILFCELNSIYGFNRPLRLIEFKMWLIKKFRHYFFTVPIWILFKSEIFNWYSHSISPLISSGAKGQSLCNSRNSFGNSRSTWKTHPFELFLVYLFKLNSLESFHLNPLVGRNLDFALPYKLFASK